ncbi:predicted protein [Arabidopsis lyrata subsp. lyrata]|uniref:Predicted protein n=1 Tax=Arabidopsis lyrata subsp. lyrata TaxID=81972 RepID=D7L2K0_ARALL|nr:predicted protein [Arabidopsis lyrata subsp. lyrata]
MDVIMKSASSSLIPDVVKNPNMPYLSRPSITGCEIRTVLHKRPLRDPSPSSRMDITTPTLTKPLFLIPAPSLDGISVGNAPEKRDEQEQRPRSP